MKSKVISIIVPVYNAQNSIDKCIRSIIEQTYKNIELILIDDGSTDDSLVICNKYAKTDKRIKIIHKENGGVSSARNIGLKNANGDYISFVDSDDYLDKKMYEVLLDNIEKNKSSIGICNVCLEDENGKMLYDFNHDDFCFERSQYPANSYYYKSISGYACNKLYSRNVIYLKKDRFIEFNSNITIAEDDLFNYEIFDNNTDINYSYINNKLYHYVLNPNSAINKKFNLKKLSYFEAIEKEINILCKNGIENDFLKADYIINSVKTKIIIEQLKIESNEKFNYICKLANNYKKEINYNNISTKLKIKLFISTRLKFIYALKIKIKKEYN